MVRFHHFIAFILCRFKNVPAGVPFSKSTVFKICRQNMCRFRVNGRPTLHIFHRFQNMPASCERSLILCFFFTCFYLFLISLLSFIPCGPTDRATPFPTHEVLDSWLFWLFYNWPSCYLIFADDDFTQSQKILICF